MLFLVGPRRMRWPDQSLGNYVPCDQYFKLQPFRKKWTTRLLFTLCSDLVCLGFFYPETYQSFQISHIIHFYSLSGKGERDDMTLYFIDYCVPYDQFQIAAIREKRWITRLSFTLWVFTPKCTNLFTLVIIHFYSFLGKDERDNMTLYFIEYCDTIWSIFRYCSHSKKGTTRFLFTLCLNGLVSILNAELIYIYIMCHCHVINVIVQVMWITVGNDFCIWEEKTSWFECIFKFNFLI